jgi:hypothetical protein
MKYIITITTKERKTSKTQVYQEMFNDDVYLELRKQDPDAKQYDYVDKIEDEIVNTTIYEQVIEGEIDLKGIIDAVNKKVEVKEQQTQQ